MVPQPLRDRGNEQAGKWAKQATDEPDTHGVEWFRYKDHYGNKRMPPRSLSHLKRESSETKWTNARKLSKAQLVRTKNTTRSRSRTRPWLESTIDTSRVYQTKTGHCLVGRYL